MIIYLAGGIHGNMKPAYIRMVKDNLSIKNAFMLEGYFDRNEKGDENMKLYLAGCAPWRETGLYDNVIEEYRPAILESFYYVDEVTEKLLPYFGDFLLDSGAFTFMYNSDKTADWNDYLERYADFINRNNVDKFFELDIDSVVGYDNVLKLRERLEFLTGKKCIPVWHTIRGKEEFLRMCDEYPYVALGGIVGDKKNSNLGKYYEKAFPWFIKEAHKRGAKIHGLGYTHLSTLHKYHFDSVDSTSWTIGNRYGFVYQFKDGKLIKHKVPKGKRMGSPREIAYINFREWVKYQKWAEVNL